MRAWRLLLLAALCITTSAPIPSHRPQTIHVYVNNTEEYESFRRHVITFPPPSPPPLVHASRTGSALLVFFPVLVIFMCMALLGMSVVGRSSTSFAEGGIAAA